MKINEVIGEWIIMPQSIKPLGLIRKPGGGFDFKNKGNNRANEKAPPGREKQVKALKGKFKSKSAPYAIAWAQHNKHGKPKEDAAGVGIITKQNTTKDVKPGEIQRQLKKLHLR